LRTISTDLPDLKTAARVDSEPKSIEIKIESEAERKIKSI
jgi:hypothetical protein